MSAKTKTTVITSSPLSNYESVKRKKGSHEKDRLVVQLFGSSVTSAFSDVSAIDACQKQGEIIQEWCSASPLLTNEQALLISALLSIENVSMICILSLEPVFDFYVIGTSDNADIYDVISSHLVDYKYASKSSAAYMYMTEEEFQNCDTTGVVKVLRK